MFVKTAAIFHFIKNNAITYRPINLSNSLQMFRAISHFELHLNEENRDGAKCFEVLDVTLRTNTTFDDSLWVVPQHESGLFNKVVENLPILVNFRDRERIRSFASERRTSISPLPSDAQERHQTALT
jgi:hypothetical protein